MRVRESPMTQFALRGPVDTWLGDKNKPSLKTSVRFQILGPKGKLQTVLGGETPPLLMVPRVRTTPDASTGLQNCERKRSLTQNSTPCETSKCKNKVLLNSKSPNISLPKIIFQEATRECVSAK